MKQPMILLMRTFVAVLVEATLKMKIPKPVYMADMRDGIAAGYRNTATNAENLAKMHHVMARKVGQQGAN